MVSGMRCGNLLKNINANKVFANRAIDILNDNAKNSAAKKKTNFFRKISCTDIRNGTEVNKW